MCPFNTYIITKEPDSAGPCIECDPEREICLGGDQILPKKGYWKYNDSAKLILSCITGPVC